MFYSQFILAKKGPLGTIWIAAHLERKLRKNQVADTDIGVSVDSILSPEVPIALRLSSHLLLGVVRIYSRKVNYLFHDCSEALLKVKQAFRSTAVDLPPEESTAPYHSITLPENFDLDDFELPDSDNFQGNFIDHHVSTREQITLQDSMDGLVYSTSQFGLDERFGDGDTSQVLDLDEELFLEKVTAPGHTAVLLESDIVDPQASAQPMTPFTPYTEMDIDDDDQTTIGEDRIMEVILTDAKGANIDTNAQDGKIVDVSAPFLGSQIQCLDYDEHGLPIKQMKISSTDPPTESTPCAPYTPRLVEEVVSTNGHIDEDHMHGLANENIPDFTDNLQHDSDYRDPKLVAQDMLGNLSSGQNLHIKDTIEAGDCSLLDSKVSEMDISHMPQDQAKQQEVSPAVVDMNSISFDVGRTVSSPTSVLTEQLKPTSPTSGILDRASAVPDIMGRTETLQNGDMCNGNPSSLDVDHIHAEGVSTPDITIGTAPASTSPNTYNKEILSSGSVSVNCQPTDGCQTVSNKETFGSEEVVKVGPAGFLSELCAPCGTDLPSGTVCTNEFNNGESRACVGVEVPGVKRLVVPDEELSQLRHVLRACNSLSKQPDTVILTDTKLGLNVPNLSSTGPEPCSLEVLGCAEPVHASGISTVVQGEECQGISVTDSVLAANKISELVPSNGLEANLSQLDEVLDTILSTNSQSGSLNCPASCDLPVPEPELLLSAPAVVPFAPSDLLVQSTEKEVSTEHGVSGTGFRKRQMMESVPVQWDGSSAKASGVWSRTTIDSIPADDDILSSILVGRKSSVLQLKPTPLQSDMASRKRPRLTSRTSVVKRKVLLDDTMVLHGDTIRQQLMSTEDIRRIRKKAPCTRPEIWMIQKHLLEEEIFVESLFTGMSADLVGVHTRTYGVTDFRISELDVNYTLPEVPDKVLLLKNADIIGEANTEGPGEPLVGIGPNEMFTQIENRLSEDHLINPIECDSQEQRRPVTDISSFELQGQLDIAASMEIDKGSGVPDMLDHAETVLNEFPVVTGIISADRSNEVVVSQMETLPVEKINGIETVLQHDGNSEIESVEKDVLVMEISNHRGDDAIHAPEVNEEGFLFADGIPLGKDGSVQLISESDSAKLLPQNIPQDHQVDLFEGCSSSMDVMLENCSIENRADVLEDALTSLENNKSLFQNMFIGIEGSTDQTIVTNDLVKEGIINEPGHVIRDENVCESVRDDAENSASNLMSNEYPQMEVSCPNEFNANTETLPSDGQHLGSQEADLGMTVGDQNGSEVADLGGTVDVETTLLENASLNFSYDLENTFDENDTEFLNFDYDEEIEEEDNSMPTAEETGVLDNSGWSSRTRGVARYLQTQFDTESGHGRKVLSLDNLLSGKTKKEASRMFFETLVLKTRDYIHVHQENPFDTINIKPKGKLVKSDF